MRCISSVCSILVLASNFASAAEPGGGMFNPYAGTVYDPGGRAASIVRPGQWTTDPNKCAGQCIGIMNLSYTHCVRFGFVGADRDRQEGNIAIVDGTGRGLGVYVADGADPNQLPDYVSCVPPRYKVYGNIGGLGHPDPISQNRVWVTLSTTKYATGNQVHYTSGLLGVPLEIWGSYFAGTLEPIVTQAQSEMNQTYNVSGMREIYVDN